MYNIWWDTIVEHCVLDLYVELGAYDDELPFQILLGKNHITKLNDDDVNSFASLCYRHIVQCTVMHNQFLRTVISEVLRHV